MLSELVIAGTLLVSAAAVLNFRLGRREDDFQGGFVDEASKSAGDKVLFSNFIPIVKHLNFRCGTSWPSSALCGSSSRCGTS